MGLARNRLTAAMRLHRGRRKWELARCFILFKLYLNCSFTSNMSENPKALPKVVFYLETTGYATFVKSTQQPLLAPVEIQ